MDSAVRLSARPSILQRVKGFLFDAASRPFVLVSMMMGYVYFLIVLNRWIVTPLGLRSFGRVWQFYANYQDFGFGRRALLGTILSITKVNHLFQNEYIFAHVFIAFLAFLISLSLYALLKDSRLSRAAILGIAFSPSLLSHFAYAPDNFDPLTFLLALLAAFCSGNIYVLAAISFAGTLAHELFIFYIPTVIVLFWIQGGKRLEGYERVKLAYPIVAGLLAYLAIKFLSAPPLDEAKYEAIVAAKLPLAAHNHNFWSGYWERYSTLMENYVGTKRTFALVIDPRNFGWEAIPLAYMLLAAVIALRSVGKEDSVGRRLSAVAIAFPLLITPIATDFYRWPCLSANAALLIIVQSARKGEWRMSHAEAGGLLAFCLFAPFGCYPLDRPFPLHQFIGEKLFFR